MSDTIFDPRYVADLEKIIVRLNRDLTREAARLDEAMRRLKLPGGCTREALDELIAERGSE